MAHRTIVLELSTNTYAPLLEIFEDLKQEISCASHLYDVLSIKEVCGNSVTMISEEKLDVKPNDI